MKIIKEKITLEELKVIAKDKFGDMIKAVVDVEQGIMAIDAGMHADEEALLLNQGSRQADLWGINIYVELPRDEWLEFDSMINIRPAQGNRSRSVADEKIKIKITEIVNRLIE